MLSKNPDFFINGDRARISIRRAASLLLVNESSVRDALKQGAGITSGETAETVAAQGLEGAGLVSVIKRFASSNRVSKETRQHNTDLLEKLAIVGAQTFINSLAGIEPATQAIALPSSYERAKALNGMVSSLTYLGVDVQNPRMLQGLQDMAIDLLGIANPALPSHETKEQWCGVAERAEQLGYPVALVIKHRSLLGKHVKAQGLISRQEKRMCGGTQRPINLYPVTPELDRAIASYFDTI